MSVKRRCFIYNNNHKRNESGWKIIEVEKNDISGSFSKHRKHNNIKHCSCRNGHTIEDSKYQNKNESTNEYNWNIGNSNHKNFRCNCYGRKKKCHRNFVCTLISVKNPTSELIIPEIPITETNIGQTNNFVQNMVGDTVDLTGWTDIVPDALNAFDNITGTYTAPEDGDYQVELTINFETSVPLNVSPSLNDVPTAEIYDIDTGEHILSSFFPALSTIIMIPPLSTGDPPIEVPISPLLNKGQVIINAVVPLRSGQRIRVRINSNGLVHGTTSVLSQEVIPSLPPRIIFDPTGADTTLTIYKVRNTPIVIIDCNN